MACDLSGYVVFYIRIDNPGVGIVYYPKGIVILSDIFKGIYTYQDQCNIILPMVADTITLPLAKGHIYLHIPLTPFGVAKVPEPYCLTRVEVSLLSRQVVSLLGEPFRLYGTKYRWQKPRRKK